MKHDNYLIGVVGAEAHSIEQRRILSGIIARSQAYHAQVIVLSNRSNPDHPDKDNKTENRIFELIASESFDALILLSESFVNPFLREKVRRQVMQLPDLPVLLIGTPLPEFSPEQFSYINTSDEHDLEEITDYLAEHCRFRRIAFLTGPLSLEVSNARISGYRKSLEKHGIPFDESLVIEGDFWYHSGEALAKQYLSGERAEPEALICANDYMAFGLLDAFFAANEDITKHFAVIGYEFIPERTLHTPLLTTYQRNRQALGAEAVEILMRERRNEPVQPFLPPKGTLIPGMTCPSAGSDLQKREELYSARLHQQYADWNLRSEMESELTECRSIDEFAEIMGKYLFMVRNAVDVMLCLFEDWFAPSGSSEKMLLCRNTNHWADHTVYSAELDHLPDLLRRFQNAAVGYLHPVCFRERLFGYCMVRYEDTDTYDETYLRWLKSVSNGLEFLRLKGDVRYLLECSTVSPSYDSITGVFSASGLRDAFHLMRNAQHPERVTAVMLRFRFGQDARNTIPNTKDTVSGLLAAVGVMKRFHGKGGIIGRISDHAFIMLFPDSEIPAELLADAVYAEILYGADFVQYPDRMQCEYCGESYLCSQTGFHEILEHLHHSIEKATEPNVHGTECPHEPVLRQLQIELMQNPQKEYNLTETANSVHLNQNHFNRIFKQIYGVSFHQMHIHFRLLLAKHLLISTSQTAIQIADSCGYRDSKYFIRQFSEETGYPPKQYRSLFRLLDS